MILIFPDHIHLLFWDLILLGSLYKDDTSLGLKIV